MTLVKRPHTCPTCEGGKRAPDGSDCPTCSGDGVVWERDVSESAVAADDPLDITDYPSP